MRNSTDCCYYQRLRPYPRVLLLRSSCRFKARGYWPALPCLTKLARMSLQLISARAGRCNSLHLATCIWSHVETQQLSVAVAGLRGRAHRLWRGHLLHRHVQRRVRVLSLLPFAGCLAPCAVHVPECGVVQQHAHEMQVQLMPLRTPKWVSGPPAPDLPCSKPAAFAAELICLSFGWLMSQHLLATGSCTCASTRPLHRTASPTSRWTGCCYRARSSSCCCSGCGCTPTSTSGTTGEDAQGCARKSVG